jgi:hypothetical protein
VKGAVLGAISTNETQGAADALPLLSDAEETSGLVRMLAVLLFSLPVLLILAALVPLDFAFVPYRVAYGWDRIRGPVAVWGVALLVIEGLVYLLTG